MNAIIRTIAVVLALLSLYGCAAPMPYMGSGGYAGQADQRGGNGYGRYQRHIPAGYINADTPYNGLHGGRCYHLGFIQPTNDLCLSGQVTAGSTRQAGYGQQMSGTMPGTAPSLDGGMSPEMATELLAELERQPNPCTAREATTRTTIGAFIGGLVAAVIKRDIRWAAAGAAAGAIGGNSSATSMCQAYSDTRLALRATIDTAKPRCRDELHQYEVNGQLDMRKTRDCGATEPRDFDRIGENRPTKPLPARMQRPPTTDLPPK